VEHYNYERLSAQDNSFLLLETDALRMHVSSTQIFELGPLATPDGGVDIDAVKASSAPFCTGFRATARS
jgi:hypothetical protein